VYCLELSEFHGKICLHHIFQLCLLAEGQDGRDHNVKAFTMWMAGGGVKAGVSHGITDDYGYEAIDGKVSIHDWHATILHLLGLDHKKLTSRHADRDFRLTDGCMIMAGPRKDGFDLMLTRIGPVKPSGADKAKPRILPTMFKGKWNLENRTVTWIEQDMPVGVGDEAAEKGAPKPMQSFEMVVAADGKILIQNSKNIPQRQMAKRLSGQARRQQGPSP